MNYIKLFLCSFVKNKMTFIVIIVETAALFLSINYLVSTLNDIEMLNIAYKNIFQAIAFLSMIKIICTIDLLKVLT